jgi:hypothetical protein
MVNDSTFPVSTLADEGEAPNASGFRVEDWALIRFLVALCDRSWLRACCPGCLRDG